MSEQPPEGPDFTKGVPADDIAEGGMLAGHVRDDAVLIARVGGSLYAIGAECTHYHAPLADGLIVGGTVRCPWHHACFSLKTGEAIAAPAVDPVACWAVEEDDGVVFVKHKAAGAVPAKAHVGPPNRVVIIGGGAAGFAAAERLRRGAFAGEVIMLSDESAAPYDRPNCSKDYLSGAAPKAWMPLRDEGFYLDSKIDLRLNAKVERFDTSARTVSIAGGETLSYDVLILATGAEPKRPPIPGLDGPDVYTLRSLQDADAIIAASEGAGHVAVVGASFIGLEVAGALKQRGLEVAVIAPETTPFEKIMGREIGSWVKGVHEDKGIVFHLGRKVLGFAGGAVTMNEGAPVRADFVVLATGVGPRADLAKAAGLMVDNGVVVNDRLETSAKGVYAAGDIARYPDPVSGKLIRVEHWVHAERQGQHLARLILGEDEPFTDTPFFWSSHYDKAINYSGHAEDFDPPEVDGSIADLDAIVRFKSNGKLLAVATVGRDLDCLEAEAAFDARGAA